MTLSMKWKVTAYFHFLDSIYFMVIYLFVMHSTVCNASLLLSEPEVLFGITRPSTHRLTLNYLVMLEKYFLFIFVV